MSRPRFPLSMLGDLRLLAEMFWRPITALKRVRDRAPFGLMLAAAWLFAWLYVTVVAVLDVYTQAAGIRGYQPRVFSAPFLTGALVSGVMGATVLVLFVAAIYTPFVILLANLFERRASFSLVLREEYAATASCALAALAVALAVTLPPALVIGWQSAWLTSEAVIGYLVLVLVIPLPVFAALMTITVGSIFAVRWGAAVIITLLSFLSLFGILVVRAFTFVCSSPFLLLLLFFLLRDRFEELMSARRSRHSFRQNLEAATLNPADASAHYNLGLLYQKRNDLEQAQAAFQRAVEIDQNEEDAHYQLGRIARAQGRLTDAIQHFETVVRLAPNHSQHEIWRETALVYYDAKQYADALAMLDRFLAARPSDAEAHYWRGMTLAQLNRKDEAVQEMQACVETVRTAPAYKYRTEHRWLHLAQSFLRGR